MKNFHGKLCGGFFQVPCSTDLSLCTLFTYLKRFSSRRLLYGWKSFLLGSRNCLLRCLGNSQETHLVLVLLTQMALSVQGNYGISKILTSFCYFHSLQLSFNQPTLLISRGLSPHLILYQANLLFAFGRPLKKPPWALGS